MSTHLLQLITGNAQLLGGLDKPPLQDHSQLQTQSKQSEAAAAPALVQAVFAAFLMPWLHWTHCHEHAHGGGSFCNMQCLMRNLAEGGDSYDHPLK